MSKIDDQTLHRLHDGELSAEERARVEAELDDEARAKLAALSSLGEALRGATAVPAMPEIDVWSAVEAGIRAKATPIGWGPRMRHAFRGYRAVAVGLAAAAAAAVALFVGHGAPAITNRCDIESLEVSGATATVLQVPTADKGDDTTTVVWLDNQEEM